MMKLSAILPVLLVASLELARSNVKAQFYHGVNLNFPDGPHSARVGYKNDNGYGEVAQTGGLPANFRVGYDNGKVYGGAQKTDGGPAHFNVGYRQGGGHVEMQKTDGGPAHFNVGYRQGGGYVEMDKSDGGPARVSTGYEKNFRGGSIRAGMTYTDGDKSPEGGVSVRFDL